MRSTPQGDFYYLFLQTQGSDSGAGSYQLVTVQVAPMPQDVVVRDEIPPPAPPGRACALPPWLVKQFAYFRLDRCDERDFDAVELDLPGGKKTLAGRVIHDDFVLADSHKVAVTFVVRDNYINALQGIGAKLISNPDDISQAVLTRQTPQAEFWFINHETSGNDKSIGAYALTSVQVGGPPPTACKLEVYGVNFDFDKATLRPESDAVLTQVLGLFTADATYAAEVSGHTDNVGQHAYNMRLSGRRAAAVKDWLVAHGVAATRMTTAGYGDTRPLVPNTSDGNRFRNRRVELKRLGCKP